MTNVLTPIETSSTGPECKRQTSIAINKDAEAPIFAVADFGLVGAVFTVVLQLIGAIEARSNWLPFTTDLRRFAWPAS